MIKPGEEWGTPTTAKPDLEVWGDDTEIANAVVARPGALLRLREPASDIARAVGADEADIFGIEVAMDVLRLDDGRLAVNMLVLGTPPDRLRRFAGGFGASITVDGRPAFDGTTTTVVVATGEFLRGRDVVPRGHPGDGRAEVQVYAVAARERREMRSRLRSGSHVPHPAIAQRVGRRVEITCDTAPAVEVDGHLAPRRERFTIEVVPAAYRLLL
jgi:hypothetical protein